ncbi:MULTISPECIES: DUF3343 domain-containing protein [Dehalobacter]|jgi:hypothetical protein|uniref:DUF3343 domain-containing protein n=2 Tax=Dehalobacter restrictus TaxID=55583 RepID=A0A857DLN3_9FIRM|nr:MULTISPECIES: DUF3343 domain-containing protein [Dehalobacter]MCM1566511.1 DUF3343 domain-containing protein [Dehalobacter sp.]AHF10858.1 hypothetical protein DEHRE_12905 [Dehalobacter restrictus DSM 9455]OCZ52182.1 hypothetical protein A7D23_11240 [Dehalobacter sp. TeCB1]QHA01508.1 DUF3343 domain-containing protein [Dehalobacter restrictus]RJE47656.1 hypothetical protein A7K50_03130 [Dehalobacter sp. MCB1]
MEYIATFYSHYGAMRFKKKCIANNLHAVVMPVPRSLSSSCGSCVKYEDHRDFVAPENPDEEIEQIVCIETTGYRQVYKAKGA